MEVYVFGKLNGVHVQYPKDYAQDIFKKFDQHANSPATILTYRNGNLLYYGYIRRFNSSSQYIGFCVLLNDALYTLPSMLFNVFEEALARMVETGEIVGLNSQGQLTFNTLTFGGKEHYLQHACEQLQCNLGSLPYIKLPPLDYGVGGEEVRNYNSNEHDDVTVSRGMAKFTYTCFSKAEDFDDQSINSVRAVLSKLNRQKQEAEAESQRLRIEYSKLKQQKAQLGYVLAIAIVAAIISLILVINMQQLDQTKSDLYSTKTTLSNTKDRNEELTENVNRLSDSIYSLQSQLDEANQTISLKENEISELNQMVSNLESRLREYENSDSVPYYSW